MKKVIIMMLSLFVLFGLSVSPFMLQEVEAKKMTKAECTKLDKEMDNALKNQAWKSGKMGADLAKKPSLTWKDYLNFSKLYKSLVDKYMSIFKKGGDCAIYGTW